MSRTTVLCVAAALTLAGGSALGAPAKGEGAPARASAPNTQGGTVWGVLPYGWGIGIGGRYALPVVSQGFLKPGQVRDQLAVEFGADFLQWNYAYGGHDYYESDFIPTAGLMWALWLNKDFALYPKLDLGIDFRWAHWDSRWGNAPARGGWFFWQASVGLIFKLSNIALRAELGHGMLKLGVGFGF